METHYYLENALRTFSTNEHHRFEKFLKSPYFTKRHCGKNVILLFYLFIKKDLHKKSLSENNYLEIVKDIYNFKNTGQKYYKKILIELKSELLSYCNSFFAVESFINDKLQYEISILNELEKRNLNDIFDHYGKDKRFYKLDCKYSEIQESYNYLKLLQTVNKHRELKSGEDIDYDIEKMLLREYLKNEFSDHYKRIRNNSKKF